ncbi:hypothetical protein MPH_00326 [Macrophomina phaseolina MS6]|uniref:Uncharacterized protein n=2 Tax=Macrophomina phaseolina TaxID=35725 RepID=K2RID5_MACPH|nr:hypothetical protein MPH_00326 [Macrophomina phaseolina MS6]KAH7025407.1 hypothetical protein B0J12DRAFT_385435 [Macrophomina phaseolina]
MKFQTLIFSTLTVLLPALVQADSHGLCGCQVKSNGDLTTTQTSICCNEWGGTLTNVPKSGIIKYPGFYCQHDWIDGDAFYDCCRNNGAGDSACPW